MTELKVIWKLQNATPLDTFNIRNISTKWNSIKDNQRYCVSFDTFTNNSFSYVKWNEASFTVLSDRLLQSLASQLVGFVWLDWSQLYSSKKTGPLDRRMGLTYNISFTLFHCNYPNLLMNLLMLGIAILIVYADVRRYTCSVEWRRSVVKDHHHVFVKKPAQS